MDKAARNGMLMGMWVGSGHNSFADIAAGSFALGMLDSLEDQDEQDLDAYALWDDFVDEEEDDVFSGFNEICAWDEDGDGEYY